MDDGATAGVTGPPGPAEVAAAAAAGDDGRRAQARRPSADRTAAAGPQPPDQAASRGQRLAARLGLPPAAVALFGGVVATAAVLVAVAIGLDHSPMSWQRVALLVAGILAAEALRIDLPYRRGGTARFSLSDAAVTAGVLAFPATDVVVAAALGICGWQLFERVPPVKLTFNTAQYVGATAAAAIIVELVAPRPGALAAPVVAAAAGGTAVFLLCNTVAVSGIIATTGGAPFAPTARRMAGTGALLATGTACLGLLVVVVADAHPWALPALAVPVLLLHSATRQFVQTQVDRERTDAYAEVERRMSSAVDPAAVTAALVAGVGEILGGGAAVWRHGRWVTPVPAGSGPCRVDPSAATVVHSSSRGFGVAVDGPCDAVGLGDGVLVVWEGELPLADDADRWLERLGRSAQGHLARATAAAALAAEQATLRAVVDGTGDGICVLGTDGVVRLLNPAMATLAGVDAATAVGRHVTEVLGDGPWLDLDDQPLRVTDVVRPRSQRVWRVSVAAVRDPVEGELRVVAVHDVSQERRVARMKDDMLAVVSHELRTPLTPIKASAQLLRRRWERLSAEQRASLLEQVEQRADHLTRLVEDILVVAQLSDGSTSGVAVRPVRTDLVRHLRDMVDQAIAAHDQHEVSFDAPETLPVVTDPLRVRQVIDNLLENACKYSPAGSPVRLGVEVDGDDVVLTVADRGRGIAPEDRERVFERFERVEDPLVMETSGTGLGLYIVRATVSALGGTVALDSALGEGTTVTVRLPRGL